MAEPQIVTDIVLVTLDPGKANIGRIVHSKCQHRSILAKPQIAPTVLPGEESPPVPEREFYDHIVFVKEMSDEVEVGGVTYIGMSAAAILAVIPED